MTIDAPVTGADTTTSEGAADRAAFVIPDRPSINWKALEDPYLVRDIIHRLYHPPTPAPRSDGAADKCEAHGAQLEVCVRLGIARPCATAGAWICTATLITVPPLDVGLMVHLDDEESALRICSKRRLRWRTTQPAFLPGIPDTFSSMRSKKARYKARVVSDWVEATLARCRNAPELIGAAARAYLTDDWSEVDSLRPNRKKHRDDADRINRWREHAQLVLFTEIGRMARAERPWREEA